MGEFVEWWWRSLPVSLCDGGVCSSRVPLEGFSPQGAHPPMTRGDPLYSGEASRTGTVRAGSTPRRVPSRPYPHPQSPSRRLPTPPNLSTTIPPPNPPLSTPHPTPPHPPILLPPPLPLSSPPPPPPPTPSSPPLPPLPPPLSPPLLPSQLDVRFGGRDRRGRGDERGHQLRAARGLAGQQDLVGLGVDDRHVDDVRAGVEPGRREREDDDPSPLATFSSFSSTLRRTVVRVGPVLTGSR